MRRRQPVRTSGTLASIKLFTLQQPLAYFTKTSPDFINSRGQVITAQEQVDALAKAQSIGKALGKHPHIPDV